MTGQRGATLIEVAVVSLITTVILLAVGTSTDQAQKTLYSEGDRVDMQQKGRAALEILSVYARSAGGDRSNLFSEAPFTTTSVLPIPQANPSSVRLRSNYDENGVLENTFPEDITIAWDSGTQVLTAGPTTISNVSNFLIRYYNTAGTELTPPVGGWDVAITAGHGDTLSTIARLRFQIELEARHNDPTTNQLARLSLTSDVTVRNQLTTF